MWLVIEKTTYGDDSSYTVAKYHVELKEAIVTDGKFMRESGDISNNGGFDKIIANIENAIIQCQRIDQKSIGVILAFHKKLHNGLLN